MVGEALRRHRARKVAEQVQRTQGDALRFVDEHWTQIVRIAVELLRHGDCDVIEAVIALLEALARRETRQAGVR